MILVILVSLAPDIHLGRVSRSVVETASSYLLIKRFPIGQRKEKDLTSVFGKSCSLCSSEQGHGHYTIQGSDCCSDRPSLPFVPAVTSTPNLARDSHGDLDRSSVLVILLILLKRSF